MSGQPDATETGLDSRSDAGSQPASVPKPSLASTSSDDVSTSTTESISDAASSQPEDQPAAVSTPSPPAAESTPPPKRTSTISGAELEGFDLYPTRVKKLILAALDLTSRGLDYTYGSADPSQGGLDCSGFIHWLLTSQGIKGVPRSSNEQYAWTRKKGRFYAVLTRGGSTFELDDLQPGDLLFWTGTYETTRDIPVTHVMVYLGKLKKNGRMVMAGASEGRVFRGEPRYGVSVFDFKPGGREGEKGFIGYGRIPDAAWPPEPSE